MSTPGYEIHVGGVPIKIGGWREIDGLAEDQKSRTLQDQLDTATMYRQCFSSDAGRYVLNDLINMFFKQRVVQPADQPGSPSAGIRQGQVDVVIRIFRMIEFANTGGGKITGSGVVPEE